MTIICNVCGKDFEATRSDARFCSPRCRTESHRRQKDPSRGAPAHRRALSDDFRKRAMNAYMATEKLERLLDDDRLPRARETLAQSFGPEVRRALASMQRVADALGVTPQ